MSGLSHSNLTENEKIYAEVYHKSNIIKKELPFNIKTAFWDKETELKEAGIFGVKKIAEYIKFIDKYLEENTLKQSDRAALNTLKVNYEILLFLKDESLLNAVKQDLDESVNYYNDLSVLAGLPSFEEFSSMPIERQNTKQALENRLLDIYNAVSFNDYTLITKTTPLGFAGDMLKDLSKLVREKRGEAAEDKRPLANRNITFQLDAKAKYKFGGAGIGPMALGNVHHALAQVYDLKLNTNLGVGNIDETTGLTSLAGVLGQDKRYISDWYSALIDAHVDIAADPFIYYLNVNDSTRNVLSLLIRSGVGLNSFYFIAQPSLVEIAKNIEMKSNKLNVEFPGLVKSIRTKIAEYESEGITLDPNYDSIFADIYNNVFDVNILDRGLDTVSEKEARRYATQVAVMSKFLELLPLGDSLSAAMMASRVDTKKYGNNTIEALEYMRSVEKVIKEGTIVNIEKLLEDSYLASMHKNSIELTVKTIGKMVLNATPAFIDATQRIAIKQGAYTYDTAKKLEAISKELYTQIASEFFIKKAIVTPKKVKSLMAGDTSVAKRISRIKNLEEHPELATNKLIQRLTPIYETGKPHFLIFRKSQDVGIKNDIYQDWKKLYLSENEEVKQLAIDLLYYNYISTGFNNSIFSFFDLAPAEMLRDLGYNEFIREKLKYYQENTITDEEIEDLLESAWSNTNLIPRLGFDSLRNIKSNNGVNYLFKANKFSTAFSGIDKNGNHIYKEYVTVGTGDNIQLYKNIGTVETAVKGNTYVDGVYVLVPKKGSLYKNFQVRGNSTPSTLIKSNDINVVEGLKNLIYNRDYDALINLTNAKGEPVFKEYVNTKPRVEMLVENTENKDSESIKRDNSTSTFTVENKALLEALETGAETFSSGIEIPEGMFEYNGNVVTITKVTGLENKADVNIYAGAGDNVELSNFAIRPFTINVETPSGEKQYTFKSVEQGFHFYKAIVTNNGKIAAKILKTTDGGELRRLTSSRNLPMTDEQIKEWDSTSKSIMLNLMYSSYSQNIEAASKLLDTGNAKITHNQDTTRWKLDFPEVVMTVREMLKEEGFKPTQPTESNTSRNPSEFTNHSGGAYGGDTYWDIIGREFGVLDHRHYREASNQSLSKQLKNKGITASVLTDEQMNVARAEIKRVLNKEYPNTLEGNLQIRNYYQVSNADSVFAIATITSDKKGVTGGTNTAVQLGIKLNKPVYVWDVNSERWYKYENNSFKPSELPILTKNYAGVGSRDIESYNTLNKETGKWEPRKQYIGDLKSQKAQQAIRDVYENTFKSKYIPNTYHLGYTPTTPTQEQIENKQKECE